ncbi:MAG TPA: ATP-binding protein [Rubrivivax sp.]|nr:hypothetical protein [Burkholderiales bacterium]HNU10037.1 ATP-binding protein [Rubrivivax sp.]
MHESKARRCCARLGSAAAALATGMPAAAAQPDASGIADAGAWIFVTVAFVVAAGASFAAGLWRAGARRDQATAPAPAPTAAAAPQRAPGDADREAAPRTSTLCRLADALTHDARPVLLLQTPLVGGPRRLLQANAAALRMLDAGPQALGRAWAEVEAAAPAALRSALAEAAGGGPWWLLHDETAATCLVLGADGGAAEETASLVYTVSHDLRAPIRVVEGFTRIVKEDYGRQLDRVGNDHLDRVMAAAARMNQMIDAMLTMARLASQPILRQPVELSQLALYVVEELRRSAPEREVEVLIEPGLQARGDPTLLRLVLENLLGNAWKYSARTPRARIEFGRSDADGERAFMVRDNGAGFDMRAADRLFGLFQRLHSAKDFAGTGVGLASVRRIVQRHGGQVWAQSEPGRGATFFFTLAD